MPDNTVIYAQYEVSVPIDIDMICQEKQLQKQNIEWIDIRERDLYLTMDSGETHIKKDALSYFLSLEDVYAILDRITFADDNYAFPRSAERRFPFRDAEK